MHVAASYVRGLEVVYQEKQKLGLTFLLGITILHVFVHYGREINNLSTTAPVRVTRIEIILQKGSCDTNLGGRKKNHSNKRRGLK